MTALQVGLGRGGRGLVVAACGSGKSLVAVSAAAALCPTGLVVQSSPSLGLVAQSLKIWAQAGATDHVLAVCSDDTVADSFVHTSQLPCPVTIDAGEVAEWLMRQPINRLRLIVVTHLSAGVAGAGLIKAETDADVLVVDEAHRTAGRAGKVFGQLHHDDLVPARRRIYLTATPRILAAGRTGSDSGPVVSMDDTAVFGPVMSRYPFGTAIAEGTLDDYQIVAIGVTRRELLPLLRNVAPSATTAPHEAPLRTVVVQAALLRAAVEFGLRRVLVFAPRIADSQMFAATLARTAARLPADQLPPGTLTTCHVDGTQTVAQRARALRWLADPPDGGWTVVSNARCLGEGIDVPAVDAVVFTRPKESEIDVVQAVGRALRRHTEGSGVATILIPVLLPDDPSESDLGEWEALCQVLRAMRAHDDRLAAKLDLSRSRMALGELPQISEIVRLQLPNGFGTDDVMRAVTIRLIESATTSWPAGLAALTAFRDAHGHVRVPRAHRVTAVNGDFDLSAWLRHRIARGRSGALREEEAEALTALGVDLDARDFWERGLAAARTFHAEHGHLHPPTGTVVDGVRLYSWLKARRNAFDKGILTADREQLLTDLDPTWRDLRHRRVSWEDGLAAVTAFHTRFGHLRIGEGTIVDDIDVHSWLSWQRRQHQEGRLPPERVQAFQALDPDWAPSAVAVSYSDGLAAARAFHASHGHLEIPTGTRVNGIGLSAWLVTIRAKHRNGELTPDQIATFTELGIVWSAWDRALAAARAFHADHGHLEVPEGTRINNLLLARWLAGARASYHRGELTAEKISALEGLGMIWSKHAHAWQEGFDAVAAFRGRNGHLQIPAAHRENGVAAGRWLRRQVRREADGAMTADQATALDGLGDWRAVVPANTSTVEHGVRVPKYRQVVDELTARIARGDLKPGHRLPAEPGICSEFGVGRTTVRQALDEMRKAGLVHTVHGQGTFVTNGTGATEEGDDHRDDNRDDHRDNDRDGDRDGDRDDHA